MMRNILKIDTSSNENITIALVADGKERIIDYKIETKKEQIVLKLIDKILLEHNLKIEAIDEITVNTGPGSFTGLRVGLAVANTLGVMLNIPINGKKPGETAYPEYC